MLETVQENFKAPLYALLGGTHLVEADRARTIQSIQVFQDTGIKVMGINHCTGEEAVDMATSRSSIHFHNTTGSSLILKDRKTIERIGGKIWQDGIYFWSSLSRL